MNEDPAARPGADESDVPRKPYTTPRLVTHGSIRTFTQTIIDAAPSILPE